MENKNHLQGFAGALLIIMMIFGGQEKAQARDDWQYWHETQMNLQVAEHFTWRTKGEHRLRDDFSDLFLNNIDTGVSWSPNEYFDIGPYFKYEHSKNSIGRHDNENRWYLEANVQYPYKALSLSHRSRIAYRNRTFEDSWRYRNRIRLSYRLPCEKVSLTPFIAEEIFWDVTHGEYNQNRASAGVSIRVSDHASLSLYYLLRSDKRGGDWSESHVLGTGLTFSYA